MTPLELKDYLTTLIQAELRLSVMIWGPPGIGKSSIVRQVAQAFDLPEPIDLRLSQLAPTDLRGLPVPEGGLSRWAPPEFLPRAEVHGERGILFLDEINLAPPAVQGIAQQLILDRRVGSYQVPPGWWIWAAGNRKEDGASVYTMPASLANRFVHLEVLPDYPSFRVWAHQAHLHPQILAFLEFRPQLLHQLDREHPAWPSPRSWEAASRLHSAGLDIAPAVGPGAASEFRAFLKSWAQLPNLNEVLQGHTPPLPQELSARYAATIGLAGLVNSPAEVARGFRWLKPAGEELLAFYLFSLIHRAPTLLAQAAQQESELGRLLSRRLQRGFKGAGL